MDREDHVDRMTAITLQTLIQVLRDKGALDMEDVGTIEAALGRVTGAIRLTARDRVYLDLLMQALHP